MFLKFLNLTRLIKKRVPFYSSSMISEFFKMICDTVNDVIYIKKTSDLDRLLVLYKNRSKT